MSGRFIAVVGPSGVGKDSVMAAMAAREPRLSLVRRMITRPSDAGGEDFDGVDMDMFNATRDAGGFALWWAAHGLCYGIPGAVDANLQSGRDVLVNLSRGVLKDARLRFDPLVVIRLTARADVLEARLTARGREDAAEIARRLDRAEVALPDGLSAIEIDNSGALEDTVTRALTLLYPVSAKRRIS